jgi:hypothetical protein
MSTDNFTPSNEYSDNEPELDPVLENEILKLKLQAEFGAQITVFSELPPEIEFEFLQRIIEMESLERNSKMVSIFEYLGQPFFPSGALLSKDSLETELARAYALLEENDLSLIVMQEYDPLTIYSFITEELFMEEIQDLRLPGMVGVFCYENYHPDPKMEIRELTEEFLNGWQKQEWSFLSEMLADVAVIPDGSRLNRSQFETKLKSAAAEFSAIHLFEYVISDINVEWITEGFGMGYAEGAIRYMALLKNGKTSWLDGGFKCYFSNSDNCWRLTFFYLPGFEW